QRPTGFEGRIAGEFNSQCRGLPIAPQQASRRRAGTGPGYEVVLLGAQHSRLSPFYAGRLYTKSVEDRKPWPGPKTKRPARWPAANSGDGADQLRRVAQPVSMRPRPPGWRKPTRPLPAAV